MSALSYEVRNFDIKLYVNGHQQAFYHFLDTDLFLKKLKELREAGAVEVERL